MILLIRCDKEVKNFNNWTTAFNRDLLDIKEVFDNNDISTFLIYKKKLPDEIRKSFHQKRGCSSLSTLDFTLIKEECMIFYHADVIQEETDSKIIEDLFNYCHINNKHLILQFSLETQHLVNHICNGSEVYILREQVESYLKVIDRELKLNRLLN
jgi:putative sterol carrier protein